MQLTQLKHTLLTSALAVSLATSVFANENNLKFPISSDSRLALHYLQQELDARLMPPAKQLIRLDQPSSRGMSDAEKAALRAVFGTEQALDVRCLPGKGRQADYSLRIPGSQLDRDGDHTEWKDLQARFSVDASGKRYSASGAWPGITFSGKGDTIAVDTVRFTTQQARDASGIWLGKTHAEAEHAKIHSNDSPVSVQFEHATMDSNSKRQGKNVDATVETGVRRMQVGEITIEQLHFAMNLHGMDAGTLKTYRDASSKLRDAKLSEKETAAVAVKQSVEMFKELALKGANVELSDLSGVYDGAKYQIKGRVAMPGLTAADLLSSETALAKLDAQLDVSLPLSILHSIARAITHSTNEKAGKEQMHEQDAYDFMFGKLVGSGYARMDKDRLVAHLEIKGGMLRITDSKELIPLKTLLDALNKQDKHDKTDKEDLPPEDHSVPVSVTWRDRSLESVRLSAGNGEARAIDELCYRYTRGDHAPNDAAEAEKWCARSKNPPDLSDADHHSEDPAIYNVSVNPAYYSARFARFDESKSRELELTLSNPQKDDVWLPMISVCLQAEAPSEQACLKISPEDRDVNELSARVSLGSTDQKSEKRGNSTSGIRAKDGMVRLRVFVSGQKAHFVINDEDELEQPIQFPVELIQLGCSTADCRFKFL